MTEQTKNLVWLETVDLREIWADESGVFTPWLAEPDNLTRLGEALGIALEEPATEVSVGGYSADIVATNTADNRRVVIENQLEKTDHDHLGKILTYAAGLDASTVVWVAKRFTEEHRAALAWLNSISSEEIGFFGIEIEVRKIDDSRYAPRFNVVAMPNEWTKTLPAKTKRTRTQQAQFDFWTGFKAYATEHAKRISPIAPQAQNWMTLAIGKTGFGLCAVASAWGGDGAPEIRAEFLVDSKNSKQHYAELSKDREQIQTELGGGLLWYSADGVRQCKIYLRRSSNWQDPRVQEDCYNWLVEKLDRLHAVFQPRIQRLS